MGTESCGRHGARLVSARAWGARVRARNAPDDLPWRLGASLHPPNLNALYQQLSGEEAPELSASRPASRAPRRSPPASALTHSQTVDLATFEQAAACSKRKLRKTFPTRREAGAWRRRMLDYADQGRLRERTQMTLAAAGKRWLEMAQAGEITNRSGRRYKRAR